MHPFEKPTSSSDMSIDEFMKMARCVRAAKGGSSALLPSKPPVTVSKRSEINLKQSKFAPKLSKSVQNHLKSPKKRLKSPKKKPKVSKTI